MLKNPKEKTNKNNDALPTLRAITELKKFTDTTDIVELTKMLIMVKLILLIIKALFCKSTSFLRIITWKRKENLSFIRQNFSPNI